MQQLLEPIYLLASSVLSVVIGTWLIGELSPKIHRTNLHTPDLMMLSEMKHDLQRTAISWLSGLAASVVGAYKLKDVIDLIIATIK